MIGLRLGVISVFVVQILFFHDGALETRIGCTSPKDNGETCGYDGDKNSTTNSPLSRWYYNGNLFMCLALKYNGCGGNGNNYETRRKCSTVCDLADGPFCSGQTAAYKIDGKVWTEDSCITLKCPEGWKCVKNAFTAACCNKTTEAYVAEAYNKTCPDGSEAWVPEKDAIDSKFFPSIYVGETCADLICPETTHPCRQINPMFSKCCHQNSSTAVSNGGGKIILL